MNSPYDDGTWESPSYSWVSFIIRSLPFVLFLLLAVGGMLAIYIFYSPADGEVNLVTAVRSSSLSAPFFKPAPLRAVSQRLVQSPKPIRIAIISGHRNNDAGAVCEDGLTEAEINYNIANRVVRNLRLQAIRTELFDEFDDRLTDFDGTALISIHADSCGFYNDEATGFKIAGSSSTSRIVSWPRSADVSGSLSGNGAALVKWRGR